MATILVTGGAGFIGGHMVLALMEAGHDAVVVDDLSNGRSDAVAGATLQVGDVGDVAFMRSVLDGRRIDAVVHFAGFIDSGESMHAPARYLENNTLGSRRLLDVLCEHGDPPPVVFSSTAAVYGDASSSPVSETAMVMPKSPYALSKCLAEQAFTGIASSRGMRHVILRYFNAAGADPEGRHGEDHEPETHLIPRALQVAAGRRRGIRINGDDYRTADGTCIRDYIHVADLCVAHLRVLEALLKGHPGGVYNVGSGRGVSVRDVIAAVREVTGIDIAVDIGPRRIGDPAMLVADSSRLRGDFSWAPALSDIETIITHAWNWERRRGSAVVVS